MKGGEYGSVKTATDVIPNFLHESITRQAISPRLAIKIFVITGFPEESVGNGGKFNIRPVFCDILDAPRIGFRNGETGVFETDNGGRGGR